MLLLAFLEMLTNVEEVARGLEHDVVVVPVADAKHVGHHAVACARSWGDMYCQEQKKTNNIRYIRHIEYTDYTEYTENTGYTGYTEYNAYTRYIRYTRYTRYIKYIRYTRYTRYIKNIKYTNQSLARGCFSGT